MARPIQVTVGPLATADDDIVSLSQKAAGAQYLVINGVGATGTFSATSVATAQAVAGAGALTLDGTQVNSGVAYLLGVPFGSRIYLTSSGNDSGITFAIVGTLYTLTGPVAVTETITGANASVVMSSKLYSTIISITASGAAAGTVSAGHSGISTVDLQRRIIFTSGGNDTGITFTITGTDSTGNPITETVTGASGGAASSVLSYLTVTSVLTSGAVATTIKVGTNGVADSPWARLDNWGALAEVAIQVNGSGTVNWTVRQTTDDPNVITNQLPTPTYEITEAGVNWVNHPDSALVASTVTSGVQGNYAYPPIFAKLVLNSGTGIVNAKFVQAGLIL